MSYFADVLTSTRTAALLSTRNLPSEEAATAAARVLAAQSGAARATIRTYCVWADSDGEEYTSLAHSEEWGAPAPSFAEEWEEDMGW